jgi:hypothetical protein
MKKIVIIDITEMTPRSNIIDGVIDRYKLSIDSKNPPAQSDKSVMYAIIL